jgi:hypothetical protein
MNLPENAKNALSESVKNAIIKLRHAGSQDHSVPETPPDRYEKAGKHGKKPATAKGFHAGKAQYLSISQQAT